jgi:hypothetical protein
VVAFLFSGFAITSHADDYFSLGVT